MFPYKFIYLAGMRKYCRSKRILRYAIINVNVIYALFISEFSGTWYFLNRFRKIFKCKMLLKSVQSVVSCCMWIDIRTDRYNNNNSLFLQFFLRTIIY